MSKYKIVEHKVPCQHIREYPRALANTQEDVLYLSVKQYIPLDNPNPQPGDVTIIGAHANGFPKELYEPLWDDLSSRTDQQKWRIRSIWIADVSQQGASGVLNEQSLGNDPNWIDHARDLLHMINLKRDEMPRPIIGLGHSMGAAQLVNLAFVHPRLFSTLILIDPVIQISSAEIDATKPGPNIANLSTYRRTVWPSKQTAAESFLNSPFYKKWDHRVLKKWNEYGLRDGPTVLEPNAKPPQVTLTTASAHEVHTFLRPNYNSVGIRGNPMNRRTHPDINPSLTGAPFYRAESPATLARLPELRPSTLYIFGGTSDVTNPAGNDEKVNTTGAGVGGSGGAKEGHVKGIVFEKIGHLVAMEVPARTADETAEWVGVQMQRFRQEQSEYEEWTKQSLKEKQEIDDEWKKHIGGPPVRASKPKRSKI